MSGASLLSKLKRPAPHASALFDAWAWDGHYLMRRRVAEGVSLDAACIAIAQSLKADKYPVALPFRMDPDPPSFGEECVVYDQGQAPIGIVKMVKQ